MELIESYTEGFPDNLLSVPSLDGMDTPVMIAALILGVLTCFLGLKVFRIWMGLIGLEIGFAAGYLIPIRFFQADEKIGIAIGLVLGIILAVLAFKMYLATVMLYCWLIGFLAAAYFIGPKGLSWWLLCAGIGLVIGLIGLKFAEPLVIILTGISGGFSAAFAAGNLLSFGNEMILTIAGAVLAVAGIVIQFMLEGRKRGKQAVQKATEIRKEKSVENEIEKARSLIVEEEQTEESAPVDEPAEKAGSKKKKPEEADGKDDVERIE